MLFVANGADAALAANLILEVGAGTSGRQPFILRLRISASEQAKRLGCH
jgi:hypothetical protein